MLCVCVLCIIVCVVDALFCFGFVWPFGVWGVCVCYLCFFVCVFSVLWFVVVVLFMFFLFV